MPAAPTPVPLATLHLYAAHPRWQWLQRGTDIAVLHGTLCLRQRQYLAETCVQVPLHLQAGQRYTLASSGWVELEACSSARVELWPARSVWQGLRVVLAVLPARMRSVIGV
jgi:hypothetical protein